MKQLFNRPCATALICLALAACGGGNTDALPAPRQILIPAPPVVEQQPLAFTRIDPQGPSSLKTARSVVISDNATWQALWREHSAGMVVAPPAPVIDFATQTVVAGVATGCSSLRVTQVAKTPSAVEVHFMVLTPSNGDPATPDCPIPTVSSPVFVAFAKQALPVRFVDMTSPAIPFTRVITNVNGIPDQMTIIQDRAGLEAFWKQGTPDRALPAPIPTIDFSTQSVAAIVSSTYGCATHHTVFQLVRTTTAAQLLYQERFTPPLLPMVVCVTMKQTSVTLLTFEKQTVPVNFVNFDGVNREVSVRIGDIDFYGKSSAIQTDRNAVVTDLAAWQALWNEHTAGDTVKRNLPPVDFATQSAVALFRRVPNGCSGPTIMSTVALADSVEIRYWSGRADSGPFCQIGPLTLASFAIIQKTPLKIEFMNITPVGY